jgi:uncharacterized protein
MVFSKNIYRLRRESGIIYMVSNYKGVLIMTNSIDLQFVEYIVKSLVGKPDAVKIDRRIDEKGVLLELTVDPEDLGRVIGKRGATAQSIRTLLRALGTKNEARYNLKIVDNGPAREPRAEGDAWGSGTSSSVADNNDDTTTSTDDSTTSDVVSNTRKELEELDDLDV